MEINAKQGECFNLLLLKKDIVSIQIDYYPSLCIINYHEIS